MTKEITSVSFQKSSSIMYKNESKGSWTFLPTVYRLAVNPLPLILPFQELFLILRKRGKVYIHFKGIYISFSLFLSLFTKVQYSGCQFCVEVGNHQHTMTCSVNWR